MGLMEWGGRLRENNPYILVSVYFVRGLTRIMRKGQGIMLDSVQKHDTP